MPDASTAAASTSPLDFRVLAESLPQIVWSCDPTGVHDYFNARWQEFTGHREDVDPEIWKALVHPEDQHRVFATWQQCLITGNPYDIDYRFRRADGEYRWLRVMARAHIDHCGRVERWYGTSTDIHDTTLANYKRERITQALQVLATIDDLTGLLNRRAFSEHAEALLANESIPASVLMIDIDNFKSINDTHGHLAGDAVLRDVALRLSRTLPVNSLLGRIGGEEFIALIWPCSKITARHIANRLRASITSEPVAVTTAEPQKIPVTVSIGGCTKTADTTLSILIENADNALYQAKNNGRNQYRDHHL